MDKIEPVGFIVLVVLIILIFIITLATLITSRKYSKTRISLSLEVERNPIPEGEQNDGHGQ